MHGIHFDEALEVFLCVRSVVYDELDSEMGLDLVVNKNVVFRIACLFAATV